MTTVRFPQAALFVAAIAMTTTGCGKSDVEDSGRHINAAGNCSNPDGQPCECSTDEECPDGFVCALGDNPGGPATDGYCVPDEPTCDSATDPACPCDAATGNCPPPCDNILGTDCCTAGSGEIWCPPSPPSDPSTDADCPCDSIDGQCPPPCQAGDPDCCFEGGGGQWCPPPPCDNIAEDQCCSDADDSIWCPQTCTSDDDCPDGYTCIFAGDPPTESYCSSDPQAPQCENPASCDA